MEQYTNEGHILTQFGTDFDLTNYQNHTNENEQSIDLSSFFASQPDPFEYEKSNGSNLESNVTVEKQIAPQPISNGNDQKEGLITNDNNTTTQTLKRKQENEMLFKEFDPSNLAKRRVGLTALSDRQRVLHPDYKTAFSSIDDICNRLLPYHLFSSNNFGSGTDIEQVDTVKWKEESSKKAEELLAKFEKLKQDHLKATIKTFDCVVKEDQLLLDKLNTYEEKAAVDALKRSLSTGMPMPGVISPNPLPSPFNNSFPVFSLK